ncbi:hypothetical protein JOL62DRAFT_217114 [Phyllosticta paracitricarpa]|uniref:C2H2-type domain-containing protein n=1 Tax=Phyllosticta paracitricarpa TaxID=2016321 RepID=A0ABR1N0B8_9PEZI
MRCGSCLCLACIAFVACSRTHRRCIICSTRPPRAPKPSESASLCQKKLESSTRPPGKSPCSCTCMTTPVAWPGTSPDGPTVPRYMPSYLPRLTPDPLYNTTLMGFFFCVQISPELFQSDQPRGFDLQPRLPLGSRHLPIAAENIFCRWLHCNVACGHCFCSFSHAGKASHPRNGPDHDKPPVLAPPTHQQGQKPRGHQNMFNLQLCCDISIVVAAAAAAAVVCRHRATPLLDQAFSQTRPLTPKPSTATCNAPVPTYLGSCPLFLAVIPSALVHHGCPLSRIPASRICQTAPNPLTTTSPQTVGGTHGLPSSSQTAVSPCKRQNTKSIPRCRLFTSIFVAPIQLP